MAASANRHVCPLCCTPRLYFATSEDVRNHRRVLREVCRNFHKAMGTHTAMGCEPDGAIDGSTQTVPFRCATAQGLLNDQSHHDESVRSTVDTFTNTLAERVHNHLDAHYPVIGETLAQHDAPDLTSELVESIRHRVVVGLSGEGSWLVGAHWIHLASPRHGPYVVAFRSRESMHQRSLSVWMLRGTPRIFALATPRAPPVHAGGAHTRDWELLHDANAEFDREAAMKALKMDKATRVRVANSTTRLSRVRSSRMSRAILQSRRMSMARIATGMESSGRRAHSDSATLPKRMEFILDQTTSEYSASEESNEMPEQELSRQHSGAVSTNFGATALSSDSDEPVRGPSRTRVSHVLSALEQTKRRIQSHGDGGRRRAYSTSHVISKSRHF